MNTPENLSDQSTVQEVAKKPWHAPQLRKNIVNQDTTSIALTPVETTNCS